MGDQGFDELAALTERPPLPDEQLTEKDRLVRRIADLERVGDELAQAIDAKSFPEAALRIGPALRKWRTLRATPEGGTDG